MAPPPKWQALEVKVPGKDVLASVRGLLEVLVLFMDIAKTLLNVVKTFLQAIGNPIKALCKAIIITIRSLLETLKRTGLYAWFNFPDLTTDPNMKRISGGYPGFVQRWKGSLADGQDINRPQPIPGFMTGGFLMIVADVQGPAKIIRLIKILMKLFKSGWPAPRYLPPVNIRINPARNSIPLTSLVTASIDVVKGKKPPTNLLLRWDNPTTTPSASDDMTGLAADIQKEFTSVNWLIERSDVCPNDETMSFDSPGLLYKEVETDTINPRTNERVKEKILIYDEFDQPVLIMKDYFVLSVGDSFLSFIGGSPRYLDETIKLDQPYWYRIRSFTGELAVQGTKIQFKDANIQEDASRKGVWRLTYPGTDVVMGEASPLIRGFVPTFTDFDVVENIRRLFLLGFSLNFGLPRPNGPQKIVTNSDGEKEPALDASGYPVYLPLFDAQGNPIPPATNLFVGQGELSEIAFGIGGTEYTPGIANLTTPGPAASSIDIEGKHVPWTTVGMRYVAARNTVKYANLLLDNGDLIESFRELMQGPLPFPDYEKTELKNAPSVIRNAMTLEELVFSLTEAIPKGATPEQLANQVQIAGVGFSLFYETTPDVSRTFATAFYDKNVRKNVMAGISFLKSLGYQGRPPDWNRIALADLVPWSAQLLWEVIRKIQALADAFDDLLDEIIQFINMIERKINVLERFIKFLIMILNVIEQLSAGFYFLFAKGLTKGIGEWYQAIDSAGGERPKSTADGGYTSGLCLAFLAPNVDGIVAAFEAIF